MTVTGMNKHIHVLEGAGLVTTEKSAAPGNAGSAASDWTTP